MYQQKPSNYNKYPIVPIEGDGQPLIAGWDAIIIELQEALAKSGSTRPLLAVDCYQGIIDDEVLGALSRGLKPEITVNTLDCFKDEKEIREMTFPDVTDDRLFGYLSRLVLRDYLDTKKVEEFKISLASWEKGEILVYGPGAALLAEDADILIYADMARWEIQKRFRRNLVDSLGLSDRKEGYEPHYKRGWFVDWRVLDRHKKGLLSEIDFYLDTNTQENPVMARGTTLRHGMREAAHQPFRMVPYFDPGPWGGKWMQEVCDLDRDADNFAWCIDCVMEDQSLCLEIEGERLEMPAGNLAFFQPRQILGDPVHARFGDEFPIRFDFLDTMGGGNLSLQVHPVTLYAQETFGVHYTQDESYYILDAEEDAVVYLGLQDGIEPNEMIADLQKAQREGIDFDAEGYANVWPAKKHDHFLIPGGTVHCSGKNSMVLEISTNPYMFTFKLWDWGRLGLDGQPRPINIEHGRKNIQWERTTEWVKNNLVNRIEPTTNGKGWQEERTGLHEMEFIETRRTWFTEQYMGNTGGSDRGSCHVINLVEGREAVIESPNSLFEPFIIHYAETTVIPASVGEYSVRPFGDGEGTKCGTLTAWVRTGIA